MPPIDPGAAAPPASSLAQALAHAAAGTQGLRIFNGQGELETQASYRELLLQARARATQLRGLATANVDVMYLRGSGIGNEAFCITGKQVNYDPTRGDDGSLTFGISVPAAAYGADWCVQLSAG